MLQAGSAVLNNQQYFKDLLEVLHWDTVIKERNQSLPVIICLEQGGSWCYRLFSTGNAHCRVAGRETSDRAITDKGSSPAGDALFSFSLPARRGSSSSSSSPRHSPFPLPSMGTGSRLHFHGVRRGTKPLSCLSHRWVNNAGSRII